MTPADFLVAAAKARAEAAAAIAQAASTRELALRDALVREAAFQTRVAQMLEADAAACARVAR